VIRTRHPAKPRAVRRALARRTVVEAGGIEPPSRDALSMASTCVSRLLDLVRGGSDERDPLWTSQSVFSSFPRLAKRSDQPAACRPRPFAGKRPRTLAGLTPPGSSACWHLSFFPGFYEATWNLGTPPSTVYTRSNPFAPDVTVRTTSIPGQRFSLRNSRSASRFFMSSRRSWVCFPWQSPSSTLARPRTK